MMEIVYRAANDSDAEGLIDLVTKCYEDYEGCILDVDAEEPQLRYIASFFAEKNGEFWVAELNGKIIGSIGYTNTTDGFELKHLYVDADIRRQGLATNLCDLVESSASKMNIENIKLWTDTRFHEAHLLYEKRGFAGKTLTRVLHDLSNTTEYYYEKALPVS